jgi:hypothetical protein
MKKLMLGAAIAASMFIAAPAANAAVTIISNTAGTNLAFSGEAPDGSISGTFAHTGISGSSFEDTYKFSFDSAGVGNAGIVSTFTSKFTELTNVEAFFNGQKITIVPGSPFPGADGFTGSLTVNLLNGQENTLLIRGDNGGFGSYSGTVSFVPTSAVPEPATWAMMIIGFGAAGTMVRTRRKLVPTVA